jgi:hypothetical protein
MTTRSVPPSVVDIRLRGRDLREQHARRLMLSGFDVESAAVLTNLPLDRVRELAKTLDADEFGKASGP